MDWHVLYLRPRCEKKMAEYCETYDVPYYLPLRVETKIYQRRKVRVEKPVFPGYLFLTFTRDQRLHLLKSNNIVRIMEVEDQDKFLHELEQIRMALAVDSTLGACAAFTKGRMVRIVDGTFRGVEGVVDSLKGATRVVLNVDMIGQGVAVEVETDYLEPMD
jgi:transcriptional antiterminator RfaH